MQLQCSEQTIQALMLLKIAVLFSSFSKCLTSPTDIYDINFIFTVKICCILWIEHFASECIVHECSWEIDCIYIVYPYGTCYCSMSRSFLSLSVSWFKSAISCSNWKALHTFTHTYFSIYNFLSNSKWCAHKITFKLIIIQHMIWTIFNYGLNIFALILNKVTENVYKWN